MHLISIKQWTDENINSSNADGKTFLSQYLVQITESKQNLNWQKRRKRPYGGKIHLKRLHFLGRFVLPRSSSKDCPGLMKARTINNQPTIRR